MQYYMYITKRKTLRFFWRELYKNWFRLKLGTVLKRTIKMSRRLLLVIHNEKQQQQDNWSVEWKTCKQVMARECRILVVQASSTWLSEYNLNSLAFFFSSKLIILKESYVSRVFLIISGSSLRRKYSKFSQIVLFNRLERKFLIKKCTFEILLRISLMNNFHILCSFRVVKPGQTIKFKWSCWY